jgi:glutathione S-transferase
MTLTLYELGGLNDRRYSLFSWRTRMALAHRGDAVAYQPVRVSDKAAIAFSKQDKVPILVDGDTVVHDSWRIAQYLEARGGSGSLFGGETAVGGETAQALTRFVNSWVDRTILPRLAPLLMIDVMGIVDEEDGKHLRKGIEKAFGKTLEELSANRDKEIVALRRLLDPARAILRSQLFLSGSKPSYADHILFSPFQWARIVSPFQVLEPDDALVAWRERMLDLYGGFARTMPARA